MRISVSVERLRVWLLVGAGLLVLVIASFLGYAHYRAHRFLTELPGKLGVDVTQETNAFTYSQSVGGRTVYTIHAAKAVQHKDGRYTLHDVGIVVYGRTSDRADRIYGSEFEYDQKAGVVRAMGEVHLDLEAPAPADAQGRREYAAGGGPAGAGGHEAMDARMIHVQTSGLVFSQTLGVAATDQEIEFDFNGLTGHAVGADYHADTGLVVLHSAVKVVGLQGGRPVSLTATRAELDRPNRRVVLAQAKYVLVGGAGADAGQTAEAQKVVVHLRDNGSAERMEAEGAVTLTDGDGGTVSAPRGNVLLNAESRPQSAVLSGGVRYGSDTVLRQAQGEAGEGRARFDNEGRLKHVALTGSVKLHERVWAPGVKAASRSRKDEKAEVGKAQWSERDLAAGAVELALAPDSKGKAQLQDAKATGDAHMKVASSAGKPGHLMVTSTDLGGDVLTAHFAPVDGTQRLAAVNGMGHTLLRRVSAAGAVNTSSGDTLEVDFKPMAGHAKGTANEISAAVQEGNVVITQTTARKRGDTSSPQEQRTTAARAVYNGTTQKLMLTGNVEVTDAASVLWADRLAVEQKTGDGEADGSVKVSYKLGGDEAEPVHVLAGRALLKHDSGQATFYGAEGRAARLWQGASQVEAPVIEFEEKEKRLVARGQGSGQGAGQGMAMAVHTVLVNGGPVKAGAGKKKKAEVVRVASRELTYSDKAHTAEFTGGVRVESADGSMSGQQAVIYLQTPAKTGGAGKTSGAKRISGADQAAVQGGFMGGSVERVVATGHIEIDQQGRHVTGERVVYTASDGMFVMTGTAAAPPKIVDETRGTVTGTSLRFHAGDESVVISNGISKGAESKRRVRTETRVKKD